MKKRNPYARPTQPRRRPIGPRLPPGSTTAHFGVRVRGDESTLRLDRESYASTAPVRPSWPRELREDPIVRAAAVADGVILDQETLVYTAEHVDGMRAAALRNFDANMAAYARLDADEFESALQAAVAGQRYMTEVRDLSEWKDVSGLYVMVLDEVRQAYVGVSDDVRKRIMRHWSAKKSLDRLIFGSEQASILSIDSFRALDTTRIFAARSRYPLALEARMMARFPERFLSNRTFGGGGPILAPHRRLDDDAETSPAIDDA